MQQCKSNSIYDWMELTFAKIVIHKVPIKGKGDFNKLPKLKPYLKYIRCNIKAYRRSLTKYKNDNMNS